MCKKKSNEAKINYWKGHYCELLDADGIHSRYRRQRSLFPALQDSVYRSEIQIRNERTREFRRQGVYLRIRLCLESLESLIHVLVQGERGLDLVKAIQEINRHVDRRQSRRCFVDFLKKRINYTGYNLQNVQLRYQSGYTLSWKKVNK